MKQSKPNVEAFIEKVFNVNCDVMNKHFKNTRDKSVWYMVNRADRTMYVPGLDVLRVNPVELGLCLGAAESFLYHDMEDPIFDWEHLNLTWLRDKDSIEDFLVDVAEYRGNPLLVGCDIETRDLSWDNNRLLAIGFSMSDDSCVALSDIPSELYPLLSQALTNENLRYDWHNGKFDCTRLKYMCGVDARIDEDSLLKHFVQISEVKNTHGLKQLGPVYLQAPKWDDELEAFKKKFCRDNKIRLADFKYDMIPMEVLIPYMQRDCIASRRLISVFDAMKEPGTDWIYRKLIEASNVFVRLELNGVMLDQEHVAELEVELNGELKEAQEQVENGVAYFWNPVEYAKDTGAKYIEQFNINSPKQLKWMLSKAVGRQLDSTDAATIEALSEPDIEYPQHTRELLEGIARTRKASKYLDTYVTAMKRVCCADGRVRGSYKLHGTETGRLSSSEPNMQNMPRAKRIKNLFRAKPGYKLLQLDYSQAELRVLGVLSNDDFLIESYREDKDLHSNVAKKIFGENYTKEQRTQCKTIAQ